MMTQLRITLRIVPPQWLTFRSQSNTANQCQNQPSDEGKSRRRFDDVSRNP